MKMHVAVNCHDCKSARMVDLESMITGGVELRSWIASHGAKCPKCSSLNYTIGHVHLIQDKPCSHCSPAT